MSLEGLLGAITCMLTGHQFHYEEIEAGPGRVEVDVTCVRDSCDYEKTLVKESVKR